MRIGGEMSKVLVRSACQFMVPITMVHPRCCRRGRVSGFIAQFKRAATLATG